MSQKEHVEEMLKAGKGYDEIEDQTGSARSYIRTIAVQYRKRAKEDRTPETKEPEVTTPKEPKETQGMKFIDDSQPKGKSTETTQITGDKTGSDYHKEWVKKGKYECTFCGATVGKSSDFCPHCGKGLEWTGIE